MDELDDMEDAWLTPRTPTRWNSIESTRRQDQRRTNLCVLSAASPDIDSSIVTKGKLHVQRLGTAAVEQI
ncbi:unnamed protein product [Closterium sp. NIES-54]